MKVCDLIKLLNDYQDFDIKVSFSYEDWSKYWINIETKEIDWIWDIWFSDKVVILSVKDD